MTFYNTLLAFGLRPKQVVADGKFYRCSTDDKPKRKNGAYVLHPSGLRGYWHNYATDEGWNEWRDSRPVTPAHQRRIDSEAAAFRKAEYQRKQAAIASMRKYFASLQPLRNGHPYLEAKGLSMMGCTGLKVDGDLLVIPASAGGNLMSLQTITPDGEKKYRYGCPISGAAYQITRKSATVTCLAEGFATGLAVYQSIPNANVIVCFDAGNLPKVASLCSMRGMTVVCADNDWETEQRTGANTGVIRGKAAAEAIGCGLAYPEGIAGTDWADALIEWGEVGAGKLRMEILRKAGIVMRC